MSMTCCGAAWRKLSCDVSSRLLPGSRSRPHGSQGSRCTLWSLPCGCRVAGCSGCFRRSTRRGTLGGHRVARHRACWVYPTFLRCHCCSGFRLCCRRGGVHRSRRPREPRAPRAARGADIHLTLSSGRRLRPPVYWPAISSPALDPMTTSTPPQHFLCSSTSLPPLSLPALGKFEMECGR